MNIQNKRKHSPNESQRIVQKKWRRKIDNREDCSKTDPVAKYVKTGIKVLQNTKNSDNIQQRFDQEAFVKHNDTT